MIILFHSTIHLALLLFPLFFLFHNCPQSVSKPFFITATKHLFCWQPFPFYHSTLFSPMMCKILLRLCPIFLLIYSTLLWYSGIYHYSWFLCLLLYFKLSNLFYCKCPCNSTVLSCSYYCANVGTCCA